VATAKQRGLATRFTSGATAHEQSEVPCNFVGVRDWCGAGASPRERDGRWRATFLRCVNEGAGMCFPRCADAVELSQVS